MKQKGLAALVIRMAEENRDRGYRRMQGALANLEDECARSTIGAILRRHGIEPAPERNRKLTWKEFLKRHWELIEVADFFTTEVWRSKGLTRFLVIFFIDLPTRRVEIAGIASQANELVVWRGFAPPGNPRVRNALSSRAKPSGVWQSTDRLQPRSASHRPRF